MWLNTKQILKMGCIELVYTFSLIIHILLISSPHLKYLILQIKLKKLKLKILYKLSWTR